MVEPLVKRGAWIAAVLLLVTALAAPGVRPPSIAEVMVQDPWQTGTVTVRGEAENVRTWPTSSGDKFGAELDWNYWNSLGAIPDQIWPTIQGDGSNTFMAECDGVAPTLVLDTPIKEESEISVDLHFTQLDFDGLPAIWAPELNCPFPMLHMAMSKVLDEVSLVSGFKLVWTKTIDGVAFFDVVSHDGSTVALSELSAHLFGRELQPSCLSGRGDGMILSKAATEHCASRMASVKDWVVQAAIDFVYISDLDFSFNVTELGGGAHLIGARTPMTSGDAGSAIQLADNGDGALGDGDQILLRLPEINANSLRTYVFGIADRADATRAVKFLVADANGPIVWPAVDEHAPRIRADSVVNGTATFTILPAYDGSKVARSSWQIQAGGPPWYDSDDMRALDRAFIYASGDEPLFWGAGGETIRVETYRDPPHSLQIIDKDSKRVLAHYRWDDSQFLH